MDLLRFQTAELRAASISGPEEDTELASQHDILAGAVEYRAMAEAAVAALTEDGGAGDAVM